MKRIALIIMFVYAVVLTSHAQSAKAYFDSKTTKQKINDNTVAYTFQVDHITTEKEEQQLEKKFRGTSSVLDVKGRMIADGKALYTVSVTKTGNKETMQNMLIAAGINTVNIDGVEMETVKSVEYANSLKAKKRKQK